MLGSVHVDSLEAITGESALRSGEVGGRTKFVLKGVFGLLSRAMLKAPPCLVLAGINMFLTQPTCKFDTSSFKVQFKL